MHSLWLISVFLHILGACFWIGGMMFLVVVLLPAIRNHPDKARLIQEAGLKFRLAGWITLGLMLITGVINLYIRGAEFSIQYFLMPGWNRLVTVKIILFLCMISLSAWHDFRTGIRATQKWIENPDSQEVNKLRKLSRLIGRINLVLALAAAAIGVMLVRGAP